MIGGVKGYYVDTMIVGWILFVVVELSLDRRILREASLVENSKFSSIQNSDR